MVRNRNGLPVVGARPAYSNSLTTTSGSSVRWITTWSAVNASGPAAAAAKWAWMSARPATRVAPGAAKGISTTASSAYSSPSAGCAPMPYGTGPRSWKRPSG